MIDRYIYIHNKNNNLYKEQVYLVYIAEIIIITIITTPSAYSSFLY